jgi:type II secretory pathway predicted ATPase ExeA
MTPNGRYLYASPTHREALASLFYGIRAGAGFMVLTGQPGMGKTTLLLEALNELREERKVVFLFQTISSPQELIRALLIDLEVDDPQGSLVDLQTKLNEVLVSLAATGKTLVVFIDEAQHLGEPTFEFVRMLSNFETASSKLMQIVLCGQPQLIEALNSSSLLQLRQRVSIFARLDGFSPSETRAYIEHRLKVAGLNAGTELFTEPAMELIVEHGKGIPRNINNICFNALSLAYALRQSRIDADLVREVIQDLGIEPARPSSIAIRPNVEMRGLGSANYASNSRSRGNSRSGGSGTRRSRNRGLRVAALCVAFFCFIAFVLGYKQAQSAGASVQQEQGPRRVVFAAPQLSTSTPVQGVKSQPTPVQEAQSQSTPVQVVQSQSTPAQGVQSQSTPAQGVQSQSTPAQGVQSQPTPAQGVQSTSTPVQGVESQTQTVTIHAGQNLYVVCKEIYGECGPQVLREMIKNNPSLGNPKNIKPGTTVRIQSPSAVPIDSSSH